MIKKFGGKFVGLLLVGLMVLALFSGEAGADSGNIGGKPANPDPQNPRTSTIFIKTIQLGASAQDAIEIINNTTEEKSIEVYAVDSVRSSGGAFACAQAAEPIENAGKWVEMSSSELKLASGKKITVPFTVTVPEQADIGEHNACIVIQEKKDETFQSGIGLNFRTAVRVAVLVPGDIIKEIRATGINVAPKQRKIDITAKVKSESNVSLDTLVAVNLRPLFYGEGSSKENTFPVLRGEEAEWNFEFDKPFWGGLYRASYSASYNGDTSLTLGAQTTSENVKRVVGPSKIVFVWGHPAALLVEAFVLLIVAGILVFIPKKLLAKRKIRKNWVEHEVLSGETLESIAEDNGLSWKKLAKGNKIKAPYLVEEGSIIKVPGRKRDREKEVDEMEIKVKAPEIVPEENNVLSPDNNDFEEEDRYLTEIEQEIAEDMAIKKKKPAAKKQPAKSASNKSTTKTKPKAGKAKSGPKKIAVK